MQKSLPSLTGLRAFESAARHLSFRKAADELSVTPAAISQQIRQLEEQLNVLLFHRTTRSLALTTQGQAAVPLLIDGFNCLHEAADKLRGESAGNTVTVSVNPSFGSCWLLPRLHHFSEQHPDISIRVEASNEFANFQRGNVDLAIRQGLGNYKGLESTKLLQDNAFVVASPQLLATLKSTSVTAVLSLPLLHVDWPIEEKFSPTWERWRTYHNIDSAAPGEGVRFTMTDMAIRAALAGMGIALVTQALADSDLTNNRLVKALPDKYDMPTDFHHFVVHPAGRMALSPEAQAFKAWLFNHVAKEQSEKPTT